MSVIHPCKFIKKSEIECIAWEVLKKYEATQNCSLSWPLDTMAIAEFLGLDFDFCSIEPDDDGLIAAMILPLEKLIIINQDFQGMSDLDQNGFRESTIGHEIGHWILHINTDEVEGNAMQGELNLFDSPVSEESFLCRSINGTGNSREWQAQYFSTCLLMPVSVMKNIRHQYRLDNMSDLYKMKDEVGVTISNLIHRLKDLGWIDGNRFDKSNDNIYLNCDLFDNI